MMIKISLIIIGFSAFLLNISCISAAITPENTGSESCRTPDALPGRCMKLGLCQHLFSIYQNKSRSLADSILLLSSQCASVGADGQILVCCPKIQLPAPGTCGRNKRSYRIFGGSNTYLKEFPWMALLEYRNAYGEKEFKCGGSLISDRYVLTAAHCVIKTGSYTVEGVRLGEWDFREDPDCETDQLNKTFCADRHVDVPIESIIGHPEFRLKSDSPNDIALIRLSSSVTYTDYVSPICLPLSDHLKRSTFEGQSMEISGWGKTMHQSGKGSDIKQKGDVVVIPFSTCQENYGIKSSQMCTFGKNGTTTCGGDSGGPLFGIDSSNIKLPYYFIAGIVSAGAFYCGSEDVPDIYTKVNSFTDWILESMESLNKKGT